MYRRISISKVRLFLGNSTRSAEKQERLSKIFDNCHNPDIIFKKVYVWKERGFGFVMGVQRIMRAY